MIVDSSPRRVWAGRRGTGIGAVFSHQSQVSAWFSGPCLIAATLFVPSVQPAPSPHGGSGARSPRTRPLTGLWLRQPSPRRAFRRPRAPRVRAAPLPARARQLRVRVGRSRRRRLRLSVTWRPRAAPPARGAPRLPDPCGGACVSCARLQACAWRCSRLDAAPVRALPSSVAVAAGNYWDLKTVGLCCRCSKTEH